MDLLTVSEVAKLMGKNKKTINKYCAGGKIESSKQFLDAVNFKYLIPLDSLRQELQDKWHAMQEVETVEVKSGLEALSEAERKQVDVWLELYEEFQIFQREHGLKKTEAMIEFGALHDISKGTLYRKFRAIEVRDFEQLVDRRGKVKRRSLDDEVAKIFNFYWLDESKPSITEAYKHTKLNLKANHPELLESLPSVSTFRRHAEGLPLQVVLLKREGEKKLKDDYGFFTIRDYSEMLANDYWIGDTHTLDIIVVGENGKPCRCYLSAWMDVRSWVVVGYYIGTHGGSNATLAALRNGIEKFGVPKHVYVDNGREFLNKDVGGLGHRARKPKKDEYIPPGVFKRLGIDMINAIVRNARAKPIERWFKDCKEQISRLYVSYTGGNVLEKPERLKDVVKDLDKLPTIEQVKREVGDLIEFDLNLAEYGGAVKVNHGLSRQEVFNINLPRQRIVPNKAELDLLMMRTNKPMKVRQLGVSGTFGTAGKLTYYDEEFVRRYFGQSVYVRFDPDDMSVVRAYDLDDRFICQLRSDSATVLKYGASQADIKEAQRHTRRVAKRVKEDAAELLPVGNQPLAIELRLEEVERRKAEGLPMPEPRVVDFVRAVEQPLLEQRAIGQDFDKLDFGQFADALENMESEE